MQKVSLHVVVGFVLFFAAMAAFLSMQYGGELARDMTIRGEAMEVHPTARVVNASCTRYYLLVSACNTEYEARTASQQPVTSFQPRHQLRFLVFGSVAGERVMLMRPRARPDVVTTSAAMAHLGNRIATLLSLIAICLVGALGLIARYRRERAPAAAPAAADMISADAQRLDDALARHLQAQPQIPTRVRTPTVSGGPSVAGTFGRRGS